MSTSDLWEESPIVNGFQTVEVKSWKYFDEFIRYCMSECKNNGITESKINDAICWRGQQHDECDKNGKWLLESAFDRKIKELKCSRPEILKKHRQATAYAFRGRLRNPSIRELKREIRTKNLKENHFWAIARHHGLATPLLDWTKSPFVAAYFAFAQPDERYSQTEHRFVYALKYKVVKRLDMEPGNFEYFDPLSSEFPRLLNQDGMFTITNDGTDIRKFVDEKCKWDDMWVLMKIKIPSKDRKEFLKHLNLMNINHLTLFPDPYGASEFCNIQLEIGSYWSEAGSE
jgi:hypothetical protein